MRKPHDVLRDTSDQDMHEPGPAMRRGDDKVDLLLFSITANLVRRRCLRCGRCLARVEPGELHVDGAPTDGECIARVPGRRVVYKKGFFSVGKPAICNYDNREPEPA